MDTSFEQQHEGADGAPEPTEAAVRRADDLDVNLADVEGTGSGGRVTAGDVEAFAEKRGAHPGDVTSLDGEPVAEAQEEQEVVPGASTPEPAMVEPGEEVWVAPSVGAEPLVTFHCSTNPNFNLSSHTLREPIRFEDGYYSTDDPAELRELRRCVSVEEVTAPEGE